VPRRRMRGALRALILLQVRHRPRQPRLPGPRDLPHVPHAVAQRIVRSPATPQRGASPPVHGSSLIRSWDACWRQASRALALVPQQPLGAALARRVSAPGRSRAEVPIRERWGRIAVSMSTASPRALDVSSVIEATGGSHDSTIVFLHGSGDSGEGVREWVQAATGGSFKFERTRVVFPTAPMRKYSLLGPHGVQRVWFDRKQLDPAGPEDVQGTDMMRAQVRRVIDEEVSKGVDLSRIVVGGFSMGAAQSLHMLSDPELCDNLAGIFALSTFLPDDSVLPERVKKHTSAGGRVPPLLWFHGTSDPMIRLRCAPCTPPHTLTLHVGAHSPR